LKYSRSPRRDSSAGFGVKLAYEPEFARVVRVRSVLADLASVSAPVALAGKIAREPRRSPVPTFDESVKRPRHVLRPRQKVREL
jgi:hypothetical protein